MNSKNFSYLSSNIKNDSLIVMVKLCFTWIHFKIQSEFFPCKFHKSWGGKISCCCVIWNWKTIWQRFSWTAICFIKFLIKWFGSFKSNYLPSCSSVLPSNCLPFRDERCHISHFDYFQCYNCVFACDIPDFEVAVIWFYIILLYVVQKLYDTLRHIILLLWNSPCNTKENNYLMT